MKSAVTKTIIRFCTSLIILQIECVLDEYVTGKHKPIQFSAAMYSYKFVAHHDRLIETYNVSAAGIKNLMVFFLRNA